MVSTGCALDSTNVPKPLPASSRTVSSKRTVCRRLRYQYDASNNVVSASAASTVE